MAQSDKMGTYHLFGYVNERPAYQHESGLDYLYYAEGEAWVIGKVIYPKYYKNMLWVLCALACSGPKKYALTLIDMSYESKKMLNELGTVAN